MSLRQNLNSSGKSLLVGLKWDQKLNFAFCDIRRVFTDRFTYSLNYHGMHFLPDVSDTHITEVFQF